MDQDIKSFVAKRDEVLASKDEAKIRAFFKEGNGYDMPEDSELFWASVHMAITGAVNISLDIRKQSKQWLNAKGYRSMDVGDL